MPLPRPKTGVPRSEVPEEVEVMLFEPEVRGFDIRSEAGGTFSVTPLAAGGSGPVGRSFMPKGKPAAPRRKAAKKKAAKKTKSRRSRG